MSNAPAPAPVTPPDPKAPAGNQPAGDEPKPIELTKEQWEAAFKSPRFTELTEAQKELKKIKEDRAKDDEDKLKKKGEYEELLTKKEGELKSANEKYRSAVVNNAITIKAAGLSVVDIDAVIQLVDKSKVEFDDNGNPTNIETLVNDLVKSKPYLIGNVPPANIGNTNGGQAPVSGQKWALTELRSKMTDMQWVIKNKAEIDSAFKEGRVDYSK